MAQIYSDPKRANDPHALPNVEVWQHHHIGPNALFPEPHCEPTVAVRGDDGECMGAGWYWWTCFPDCMPDGEANGPFSSEQEAVDDAQSDAQDDDDAEPTLEEAIDEACDVDTRNDISRVYRRLMREQGFVEGNEENGDDAQEGSKS